MTTAFIFPGQGSQAIGMGKDLYENFAEAREVFEEIDDALSQKLSALMFEGEADDLNLTANTQPALMAVSMAVMRVLEKQGGIDLSKAASFVAGHSLGEYSALTAAGSFSLADTARLLRLRGEAMQKAVPVGQGAMAAILGLDFDAVDALAVESTAGSDNAVQLVCAAANDNAPGQVVISGHKDAVARAVEIATEQGAKRAVILPVSAPFHCSLMAPAAEAMHEALAGVSMNAPSVPVIANITARAESDPETLKTLLVEQVTGRVRWRESMEYFAAEGGTSIVEIGAGKVLCGLMRRIQRDVAASAIGTVDDIEKYLNNV